MSQAAVPMTSESPRAACVSTHCARLVLQTDVRAKLARPLVGSARAASADGSPAEPVILGARIASDALAVAAAPAVEVVDLRKEFLRKDPDGGRFARKRRRPALKGVTFTLERGECVAILGQNGSGKSTLVRLLSTLLLHDGGSARVFGHDVFAEPRAVRRLVNRVSVEASFFKKMSSTENLSYAARFYGMTASETRVAIPRILERIGFPPSRRSDSMEELSRGMQQKVALARALLTAPVVLLLDEPTTGLDPRSKVEVQDFVREVRTSHDATILLCTHDLNEAELLADRIGILDRGELLCLERADELKQRYGADTLEEAFFAATGRTFAEEEDDEEWRN
jgi:ABC-2 type transport system ATP-binding protein